MGLSTPPFMTLFKSDSIPDSRLHARVNSGPTRPAWGPLAREPVIRHRFGGRWRTTATETSRDGLRLLHRHAALDNGMMSSPAIRGECHPGVTWDIMDHFSHQLKWGVSLQGDAMGGHERYGFDRIVPGRPDTRNGTSKCRCGPEEFPEVPTMPMGCPAATVCPTLTAGCRTRWQYAGHHTRPRGGCRAYQPHPLTLGAAVAVARQGAPGGGVGLSADVAQHA